MSDPKVEICYKLTLEIQDLMDDIHSLYEFISSDKFSNEIDTIEKTQMIAQYKSMLEYKSSLQNRLDYIRASYMTKFTKDD